MDNLAHSMTAAAVGAALAPKTFAGKPWRVIAVSALVANFPDIDVLLALVSEEVYYFHHRGLTHSFLGLTLIWPICFYLARMLIRSLPDQDEWTTKRLNLFVGTQLIWTHFFLDYLTTYGTMLFYPASFDRFAFPLMFIIDPLFWIVTAVGVIRLLRQRNGDVRGIALQSLFAIFLLWSIEYSFKWDVGCLHSQHQQGDREVEVIPAPLAPLLWYVLDRGPHYDQATVSYIPVLKGGTPKYLHHPVPEKYTHQKLCPSLKGNNLAQREFDRFAHWGSAVLCEDFRLEGELGCRCFSLKYLIASKGVAPFGAYWIGPDGQSWFLPRRADRQTFRRLMELF